MPTGGPKSRVLKEWGRKALGIKVAFASGLAERRGLHYRVMKSKISEKDHGQTRGSLANIAKFDFIMDGNKL